LQHESNAAMQEDSLVAHLLHVSVSVAEGPDLVMVLNQRRTLAAQPAAAAAAAAAAANKCGFSTTFTTAFSRAKLGDTLG
jgi:hypothetical protein